MTRSGRLFITKNSLSAFSPVTVFKTLGPVPPRASPFWAKQAPSASLKCKRPYGPESLGFPKGTYTFSLSIVVFRYLAWGLAPDHP